MTFINGSRHGGVAALECRYQLSMFVAYLRRIIVIVLRICYFIVEERTEGAVQRVKERVFGAFDDRVVELKIGLDQLFPSPGGDR